MPFPWKQEYPPYLNRVHEKLFRELNRQLEGHRFIIKSGAIMDASISPIPLKTRGKTVYELAIDRSEAPREQHQVEQEEENQQLLKFTRV